MVLLGIILLVLAACTSLKCRQRCLLLGMLLNTAPRSFRIFLFVLTLSHFFVFSHAYADKASLCAALFKNSIGVQKFFGETPLRHIEKTDSLRPQDLYYDYSPNDIYIGISGGHTYFWINGYRYDGGLNLVTQLSKVRQLDTLSYGVIVRVKNAPNEIIESLMKRLETNNKPISITCSSGVCRFLGGSGLSLPKVTRYYPSYFLNSILNNGIKTKNGEELKIDLTVVGINSFQKNITSSRGTEVFYTAVTVPFILLMSRVVYIAFF